MRASFLAGVAASLIAFATPVYAQTAAAPDPFLANLVGCWRLDGRMGEQELHQDVEANWVLSGHFIEMRFRQSDPPAPGHEPYEAIYLLGYDSTAQRYVLNLFDNFGVATPIPGHGVRDHDALRFYFPYATGDFFNTFTWDAAQQQWTMTLERTGVNGVSLFATKVMRRCS